MNEFLRLTKKEKAQLLREATKRHSLITRQISMEKDFWVCWVLEQLYSIPEIQSNLTFKGGTSLSKCFGLIERFSEDLDLLIDSNFIDPNKENDPKTAPSKTQRELRMKAFDISAVKKIHELLNETLLHALKQHNIKEWSLTPDEDHPTTLLFSYPSVLTEDTNYIKPVVKLEFGIRGSREPSSACLIKPYLEEALPSLFTSTRRITVNALSDVRTFWEKVVVLHKEYHRKADSEPKNKRLFRHYYDVTMLDKHGVTKKALKPEGAELLAKVVRDNEIYYPSSLEKSSRSTAKIGTLELSPNEYFLSMLEKDCRGMANMFFGEAPSFENVMSDIKKIEQTINTSRA